MIIISLTSSDGRVLIGEVLFTPSLIDINLPGMHELCYQSIMKCDEENLYANILVSGGNTIFSGIVDN